MQSTKHNTYSHLYLKMHEQLSHFILDAHFVQDAHSKRTLNIDLLSFAKSAANPTINHDYLWLVRKSNHGYNIHIFFFGKKRRLLAKWPKIEPFSIDICVLKKI